MRQLPRGSKLLHKYNNQHEKVPSKQQSTVAISTYIFWIDSFHFENQLPAKT